MKLATQDKPFFSNDMTEKFREIKEMGFDAYEIDGKELVSRFSEVKKAMEETGLSISTACGGYDGWIGDFDEEKRKNGVREISEILRHLSEIGGDGIVVPAAWGMFSKRLPPMVPPRSEEEDRSVLLRSLEELNKVAEAKRTYVYLEPLNRYEDHMINTLSAAASLIKEGGFNNVKIIADFYHMNIEEADISKSLMDVRDYLGHVHVADSHRYQPGDGHLDFLSGFRTLKEIGYDGYLAFECRVTGEDEREAYRKSVDYIRSLLTEL